MKGWINKSRRPVINSRVVTSPLVDRYRTIGEWLELESAKWTRLDAKAVKKIYDTLVPDARSTKQLSERFYTSLYANKDLYSRFVFLSRSLTSFIAAYKQSQSPRKCIVCESAWSKHKFKICKVCATLNPKRARKAKNLGISKSNKISWASGGEVLRRRERTLLSRYGVINVYQLDSVKASRIEALEFRFGKNWQKKLNTKREATNLSRYGSKTPLNVPHLRAQAYRTIKRLYGTAHAMQNPIIFEKAMRKSHRIQTSFYKGRSFDHQGSFEGIAFKLLANRYGVNDVHSQFHAEYPQNIFSRCKTFPDFWVESEDVFVEIKSTWTLCGKQEWWRKNVAKAKRQLAAEVDCRWVVVLPKQKPKHYKLKKGWHKLSFAQINLLMEGVSYGSHKSNRYT